MSASFGSVRLCVLPDDYRSFLDSYHSLSDFSWADLWSFDGSGLKHLPLPSKPDESNPEVNTLYWPTGFTNCAYGHFLVDDVGLGLIRTALGTGAGPADLVLTDGTGQTRTFSLYALPARPLSKIDGKGQTYLLPLVDVRFFKRQTTGSITSVSTWSALLSSLASQLGVTLTVGSIDADYAAPTDQWLFNEQPLSPVLDAVCNRIGHRVVANLDGTFSTVPYSTARAACDAQTELLTRTAGGLLASDDLVRPVPSSIRVVFRNSDTPDTPYVVTKTLTGLALSGYGSSAGISGYSETVYAELVYDATNASDCDNYAVQAATDWYNWRLVNVDVTYPGICEWTPTGCEDRVEWKHPAGPSLTRVVLSPFRTSLSGTADFPATPDTYGCGLTVDEHDQLAVDVASLAGDGLAVNTDGDCDKLEVTVGCHLEIDGDQKVGVVTSSLAGDGLKAVSGAGCDTLTIDFDPATTILFGDLTHGLTLINIGGGVFVVGVNAGCGIVLGAGGAVTFDAATAAGAAGLTSLINVGACGLSLDQAVNSQTTEIYDKITGLSQDGSSIKLSWDRYTATNSFNLAGVHINRTVAGPVAMSDSQPICPIVECCLTDCLELDVTPDPGAYGVAPLSVDFTATPVNAHGTVNYFWDFQDGDTSSEQNPTHEFTTPGYYLVTVTATDDCGTVTVIVPVIVGELCSCPTCETDGQPEYMTFALTGATGVFANLNGTWNVRAGGGCNYYWHQNGWFAAVAIQGDYSVLATFTDGLGNQLRYESDPSTNCCAAKSVLSLTFQVGTGTVPTFVDDLVTPFGTGDWCSTCLVPPSFDCMGTTVFPPARVQMTVTGGTGTYSGLDGTYDGEWDGTNWVFAGLPGGYSVYMYLSSDGGGVSLPVYAVVWNSTCEAVNGLSPTDCETFLLTSVGFSLACDGDTGTFDYTITEAP